MPQTTVQATIYCVDFPTRLVDSGDWTGVQLNTLLAQAEVLPSAVKIAFTASDGYTTDLDLETAAHENVIIAYEKMAHLSTKSCAWSCQTDGATNGLVSLLAYVWLTMTLRENGKAKATPTKQSCQVMQFTQMHPHQALQRQMKQKQRLRHQQVLNLQTLRLLCLRKRRKVQLCPNRKLQSPSQLLWLSLPLR